MKSTHIPLLDYIETEEEQCDVYVHTKDKRMLVFKDVQSDAHLDETGFYIDYMFLSRRMSVFVSREDFSHMEYRYSARTHITKKDFDELYSYLDEDVDYIPSETLTEL
jgi:hypothetical protein